MKKSFLKITPLLLALLLCITGATYAQNGTECYKPFTGTGKVASSVQNSVVCVNCAFANNVSNTTDNNPENFAEFNNVASVISGNGITIKDIESTYPAGWFAGYVVDLGPSTLLNANVLSAFVVSTYNDSVFVESRNSGNGLAVATVAGISQGRIYLNFKTTLPFDEIRLTFTGVIAGLSTFRIYYATAFDPECGTMDANNACDDQVAGSKARVVFNAGAVNALASISNPEAITDGDKRTATVITIPAGLLINPPYIGILDEQRVYPAGQKAGFVVRYQSNLLTASVLSNLRLETYLFGVRQEQSNSTTNPLTLAALGIGNNDMKLTFTSTKKFNEIRLVFAQVASVNLGAIEVDYAFEEPQTCTECMSMVGAGQPGVYAATINAARTTTNGNLCFTLPGLGAPAAVLSNSGNVVDADTSNFATYSFPLVGANCGFTLATKFPDTVARRSFAGFVVEQTGGLASVNALSSIVITTYRNNVVQDVSTASSLVNLGALSLLNEGKYRVGFLTTKPYDEVAIRFSAGGLDVSVGGQFRTYYPFIVRDDDGDGTQDCKEICGMAGDDGVDTDGDGTPNACDPGLETPLKLRVLLQGSFLNATALLPNLMRSDLNLQNLIPAQQPYSATLGVRFTQIGGGGAEVVSSTVLGRRGILATILVDWVLVEIRSGSNPATIVKTVSALVARNGEIVDTLGGPLMVSLPAGNYYVSVKHRNHLGVMTATAVVTAGVRNSVDFSTLATAQVFGNTSTEIARVQIFPGVYALWAGDVNGDGKVKYQGLGTDAGTVLDNVLAVPQNVTARNYNYDNLLGYLSSDVDLSGKAKYQGLDNDVTFILDNILNFINNAVTRSYNYDLLVERLP